MNTINSEHDERLDGILADYLARLDRGEAVERAEFCAAHPELAGELREFLEMANLLEYLGNGPVAQGENAGFRSTADALSGQPTLAEVGCRTPVCSPLTAVAKENPQGVQFGRYFLQEILGEGSMGTVHLAWDTKMDRFVALKVPRFQEASPAAKERFRREATASTNLRHPNICPIFEVEKIDGLDFLTMAYIDGESLARPLERGEVFPIPRVLRFIRSLAEALHEAHRNNVIHRDLKPANIMLDLRGEPIITDFGLARRLDMRETLLTQSGMLVGTLAYMSPEQLEGNPELIGCATDIYSLGVIFYQLLCGRLPYSGGFLSVILQIRVGEPQPPTKHRPELENYPGVAAVCLKMMAVNPNDRYESMSDVAAAVSGLQGEPIPPPLAPGCEEPPCVEPPRVLPVTPEVKPRGLLFPLTLQTGAFSALSALALVLAISILVVLLNGNSVPEVSPAVANENNNKTGQPTPATKASMPPIDMSRAWMAEKPVLPGPQPATVTPPISVREDSAPPAPAPAAVAAKEEPAPIVAPVPGGAKAIGGMFVTSRRAASERFGVVHIDLTLIEGNELEYRRDWPCRVSSLDQRVLYPAYQFELVGEESTKDIHLSPPRGKVRRLRTSFLTFGEQPLQIELRYGDRVLLGGHEIPIDATAVDQEALLTEWWARYTLPPREPLNDEARELKTYLHDMLARRLRLPVAKPLPLVVDDASVLERYFEKSVGTFLGFASVQSALGEEDFFTHRAAEPLDQDLPLTTRLAPVQYPPPAKQVTIETIASHAPDDCVYLRCQSLENYLWFRELLQGWGGGLNEIVSPLRIDRPVRERLERQLALSTDAGAQAKLKTCLTDLALIFGDTCFTDGAAVGVLFQAKDEAKLKEFLKQQRNRALHEMQSDKPTETLAKVNGGEVSLIYTSDNRLRSYHAVSGKFHLITNSEYLVGRFFECSRGTGSLANLKEFQFARTKVRVQAAQDVFLYMPDPFFQRVISPAFQIELGRRRKANADLQHLELAQLAAKGEGFAAARVNKLIETGFLPTNFSDRSDGSYATLSSQRAEDSERGAPGTFIPICDLHVTKATRSEVRAYRAFSDQYRRNYRMMDPVAVVVSHQELADGREDVKIQIAITPFALGAYAKLQNSLDQPQKQRIVGPPEELLSLRGSLRTEQGTSFLALASLHDRSLEFRLVDGQVQIEGLPPGATFAGNNWLLAMDRLEPDCLQSVAELAGYSGVSASMIKSANSVGTMLLGGYVDLLGRLVGLQPVPRQNYPVVQPSGKGWQLLSPRDELQEQAAFKIVPTADNKQIRFELKALQGTKIEPYIQAYTYLEARRASAKQAALLELTMQQLRLQPGEVLPALERIHAARFRCPLQGRLEFAAEQAAPGKFPGNQWCSDRWLTSSLYDETTVPEDYRFLFTDWLRGLNVGFSLEGQTLSADLRMEVLPRDEAGRTVPEPKQPALQK